MSHFPSIYEEIIFKSRYARWRDDLGRREEWPETVARYFDFFEEHLKENNKFKLTKELRKELEEAVLNLKVMPSMRALMTAGPALKRDNIAGFNCAYLPIDNPRSFDEVLMILMCGTGIGFSVEHKDIDKLPVVNEHFEKSSTTITVDDSKQGWAKGLRELIAMLYAGQIPSWDLSRLRPAGAILKTFGGRSSGPEPLGELFQFTVDKFVEASGRRLLPIEAHDIICKIAEVVVVGGVRRCLPKGTLIQTKAGLERIETLSVGNLIVSHDGTLNPILAVDKQVNKELLAIKTNIGTFYSTPNHRWLVGDLATGKWKEAKDLLVGDLFRQPMYKCGGFVKQKLPAWNYDKPAMSTTCKDINIPELDLDMAWFFGYLHGNGYVQVIQKAHYSGGQVTLSIPNKRPEIIKKATEQLARFGTNIASVNRGGDTVIKTKSRQLALYLSQFKIAKQSIDIPDFILQSKKDIRAAYIAGIFDADGAAKNRPVCIAASIYEDYLRQLRIVLSSLGIYSTSGYIRPAKGNWKELHHLSLITKRDVQLFNDIIGPFSFKWKKEGVLRKKDRKAINTFFVTVESIQYIENEDVYDIQVKDKESFIADGIVSHNSALISLSNLDDRSMQEAKSGRWWELQPQRALANNSAVYSRTPDAVTFIEEWLSLVKSQSGERGIFNRHAAIKQADRNGRRDTNYRYGSNPCNEIILRPNQFCNLSEVIVRETDTLDTLKEKVRVATILGTFQSTLTDFKYLRKVWRDNTEEERLLGVSLTGMFDNLNVCSNKNLEELKNEAIKTNNEYSKLLKIPQSTAITCVKPSGTVSQLVNAASGIHPRHSEYYIRTIRGDKKDPLTKFLIDVGIPYEDDITKPKDTVVFSFPQNSPKDSLTRELLKSAVTHLDIWLDCQRAWCEHKPSVTISVKSNEWVEVAAWVYEHFDEVTGISFLPYSEHTYKQAPYQECTKEEYEEALAKMPKEINWDKLAEYEKEDNTVSQQQLACVAGVCDA